MALVASAGLGLGFYPAALPLVPVLAAALASASFGAALRGLRAPGPRKYGTAALVFGAALVAGAALAHDAGSASRPLAGCQGPAIPRFGAAGSAAAARPMKAARPGNAALSPSAAGPSRLRLVSVAGRLRKDSASTRGGSMLYTLDVDRSRLAAPGISGEIWPGERGAGALARLDVMVRGGPLLDAGTRIELRGAPRAGGALAFAQPRDIAVVDRGTALERLRSGVRECLRSALFRVGERSSGLLLALILGAQDCLDREDADAFRAAGCTHILALSGEHLSVLAVLALLALRPLFGPVRARLGAALLATLFVWAAGPAPSLVRAVLMVWLSAVALFLDRPQSWLVVLCLCFVISLPFDPEGARSLSFVLSYLAVWGLAVLAPRLEFILQRWIPPPLAVALAASLAAQAATAPILIATFGTFSLIGAFASIAAAPLVTAFMWWGIAAACLCSVLPQLAPFAVPVSDLLYLALTGIMKTAAAVPPVTVQGTGLQAAACCAVAALTAFVYALPDVSYRLWLRSGDPRLRRALFAQGSARERGPRHVQAPRPEFSGK
ncbi:MAG: ComEC/Rec2 family competence protein [Treponema sp.]|nr:ComEC/Rec2 family competence protein [Treponema sp.]